MVDGVIGEFPGQEREVNNMVAGVNTSCIGIGQVIAPIYGALLEQNVGFKHTTTATAGLNLIYGLAYFAFGGGVAALSKTYRNFKEKEDSKESSKSALEVRPKDDKWFYDEGEIKE